MTKKRRDFMEQVREVMERRQSWLLKDIDVQSPLEYQDVRVKIIEMAGGGVQFGTGASCTT